MTPICGLEQVTKKYKATVLDEVTVGFESGKLHAIVGRNGVGKSTLLSLLAGTLRPTSGSVTAFGEKVFDNASVMSRICCAGIDVPYPGMWSVRSILSIAERRWPHFSSARADELLRAFDLDLKKRYGKLSRGQKSMVGIVVALASMTELTLLDEPYLGLDVNNRELFYKFLREEVERGGRTFIVATHHLEESAGLMDTFTVLGRDGRVRLHADAAELEDAYVYVTAGTLAPIDGETERSEIAGVTRVLAPADAAARISGPRVFPAPLEQTLAALVRES
ncbi:ATP-binding cassette domain-containing protein [Corynebacterium tapiri]|uniref:ABC transporter ATP-binding protein n=1 Tax=Corynebacterium tapiri TaxID=1448266 RepID=A0A5C4U1P0_9CORY|nr:ABC transporter ATP-binding protein [Corynebacterium tapiri]TNL95332.1 ABC transporter ATP-binding protein [Corynebacterium tapiri]